MNQMLWESVFKGEVDGSSDNKKQNRINMNVKQTGSMSSSAVAWEEEKEVGK